MKLGNRVAQQSGLREASPVGRVVVVVPCFNEAIRLDPRAIEHLVGEGCDVVLVDDGSTDQTLTVLGEIAASQPSVSVLALGKNCGKAEAVRRGLRAALATGACAVGFLDADMSTPPEEMVRLVTVLLGDDRLAGVIGSRVNMLGSTVERSALRHYFGRVFASIAAWAVGVPVYDTQCGAKVFRASTTLDDVLTVPFESPWAFDVELLIRLRRLDQLADIQEVPLRLWRSVDGSKLTPLAMVRTTVRLVGFAIRSRRFDQRSSLRGDRMPTIAARPLAAPSATAALLPRVDQKGFDRHVAEA